MPHSVALWSVTVITPEGVWRLARGVGRDELADDAGDAVAEIMRRYPGLSRVLAEYLAR